MMQNDLLYVIKRPYLVCPKFLLIEDDIHLSQRKGRFPINVILILCLCDGFSFTALDLVSFAHTIYIKQQQCVTTKNPLRYP